MRTRTLLPLTLVVGAALLAGCASPSKLPAWTYAPSTAAPEQVASATGAPAPAVPAEAGGTLEITSFDLGFEPAQLTVPQAGRYDVKLTNTGSIPHDITFPGGEKVHANGGETASVEVDIPAEGLSFICSIPGHEQAGMTGAVTVGGAAPAEPAAGSAGAALSTVTAPVIPACSWPGIEQMNGSPSAGMSTSTVAVSPPLAWTVSPPGNVMSWGIEPVFVSLTS